MNWEDDDDQEMSYDEVKKTPIYQKAYEIMEMVQGINVLVQGEGNATNEKVDLDREITLHYMSDMVESSMIMLVKVGAHYGPSLYSIQMEAATLIRMHAMRVRLNINGLEMGGYEENEYFKALRNSIDEFRILFAEWVVTFDPWNYVIDRWGLFNPPGVNYYDKDPDDDLPFDNPLNDL